MWWPGRCATHSSMFSRSLAPALTSTTSPPRSASFTLYMLYSLTFVSLTQHHTMQSVGTIA